MEGSDLASHPCLACVASPFMPSLNTNLVGTDVPAHLHPQSLHAAALAPCMNGVLCDSYIHLWGTMRVFCSATGTDNILGFSLLCQRPTLILDVPVSRTLRKYISSCIIRYPSSGILL